MALWSSLSSKFQSTHPVRGATAWYGYTVCYSTISIHAPRAGCDVHSFLATSRHRDISIHAPRAGCDGVQWISGWPDPISIHAPRAGCDFVRSHPASPPRYFNPRTPCGVRLYYNQFRGQPLTISIHAPRAGCDPQRRTPCRRWSRFQSTHPVRGATRTTRTSTPRSSDFNPRTPCGVRLVGVHRRVYGVLISIHAPRAGCDVIQGGVQLPGRVISIHAPRAGCDPATPPG